MMLCNHTSRFDVAAAAVERGAAHNAAVAVDAHERASHLRHLARKEREYIYAHGQGAWRAARCMSASGLGGWVLMGAVPF